MYTMYYYYMFSLLLFRMSMWGSFINAHGRDVVSKWTFAQTWNDMWEANTSCKWKPANYFYLESELKRNVFGIICQKANHLSENLKRYSIFFSKYYETVGNGELLLIPHNKNVFFFDTDCNMLYMYIFIKKAHFQLLVYLSIYI